VVKRGIHKESREEVAIKVIPKQNVNTGQLELELDIMDRIGRCPQVVSLLEVFEDSNSIYLISELVEGGNLLELVLRQKNQHREQDTARIMKSILLAILYCHNCGVVHRDIKPDNLLISKDLSSVQLSDFGLATVLEKDQTASATVGTRAYLSPEMILKEPYSYAVDMWGVGCIAYVLLCGYHPFSDYIETPLYIQIVTGQWEFHEHEWANITDDAKDFVSELLILDPAYRMTAQEALRHPWIRSIGSTTSPSVVAIA